MNILLAILLVLAVIATAFFLVRGLVTFLKTTEQDLKHSGDGPSPSQLKQNKMMMNRILFQGLAIVIVILLLMMARG